MSTYQTIQYPNPEHHIRKSLSSNRLLVPYTALNMSTIYEEGNIKTKQEQKKGCTENE
jgi:hypothetical protein